MFKKAIIGQLNRGYKSIIPSLSNLPTGIIAWWKLNDGIGTIATDSSGNGKDGTLSGTSLPTWGTGPNGNPDLIFVSVNGSFVNIANSSTYADDLGSFTVSAWFNTVTNVADEIVVSKMSAGGPSTGTGWYISVAGGKVVALIQNGATGQNWIGFITSATKNDGAWHHVAMVVSGNQSSCVLYIDGSTTGTTVDNGGTFSSGISNVSNINIGADTGAADFFNGQIDDVRIYNIALNASDVLTLFNSGAA